MDLDLQAQQEARELTGRAAKAAEMLQTFPQETLDAIVEAVAAAFSREAFSLAEAAVKETGFGNAKDKEIKNRFACETVLEAVRGMKTVGILSEKPGLWEIGVPKGVIAAIVPSTNPTSTVCYKAILALKAGCPIVFSPHPRAAGCTRQAVEIIARAAEHAGAPLGSVSCLSTAHMAGCRELMSAPAVGLILATGGPGLVRAAYSSGKPAIGVGAGNGPAYLHGSCDLPSALDCVLRSKTFDNGTVCASEQSMVVEKTMEPEFFQKAESLGFYFLSAGEKDALARLLFRPDGSLNPETVGKTAIFLAQQAGFSVPKDTKILVARESEVGKNFPYSGEKLCPVLTLYVVENEQAALSLCQKILRHEGAGHTFAIHATDEGVIRRFAEKIPASRFLVNTPASLGGVGLTTKLFPALTLGCGAIGGSISSQNVSPMELIDIRKVAWGVAEKCQKPAVNDALVELLTEKILKRLEG